MAVEKTVLDFNKICRLCLMEESVMASIYNEQDKHSSRVPLPLRIMACVSIELNSIDGLPSHICTTCLCQVDGWYKFKDLCESADAFLKQCINNEPVQLDTISQIRSKAQEIRQFFASPHLVKVEGLDSALNQLNSANQSVKNVESANGDEFKLYSLLKFGSSGNSSESLKDSRDVGIGEGENVDETTEENVGVGGEKDGEEGEEDSSDEETLANRFKSDPDTKEFSSSSSDLNLKMILTEKNKSGKVKSKKKLSGKKSMAETVETRCWRTVKMQAGGEEEEGEEGGLVEVVETGVDSGPRLNASPQRKRLKSRKCQTPREQCGSKKRFRVRPAVPSSCTLCDKVYKNGEILRQHMKSHHVTGTIECPSCKLTFTSLRSLKYHEQRKHSNLEPVPCTFCGKKFLDKKYLRIHENIHSQANHFVCQFCGRKFIMKTNLTVHISRHHTKKSNDFVCQICGKAFPFKLYLKKHFKTHTDHKPYQCAHCEAKFRENTLLRKHVNSIHLKLRPFLCQYCNKTFTRSLYLREHMESQHLGIQRKVECSRCGEAFQNRNRLRQHECLARMEIVRVK